MKKSTHEKERQLGLHPATAANRLKVDLLHSFAVQLGHKCYRCGGVLDRETFSVEHKVPWLHTDNPTEMFFDLGNIAFSHLSCNVGNKRINKKYETYEEMRAAVNLRRRVNGTGNENERRRVRRQARRDAGLPAGH